MVRACGSKPSVDTKLEKKAQEMKMWKLVLLICLSPLVVALIAALPFLTVFFWCVIQRNLLWNVTEMLVKRGLESRPTPV